MTSPIRKQHRTLLVKRINFHLLQGIRVKGNDGFSLIEVMIVVALMAFVYTYALPQLNLKTGAEIATKISQLNGDIRNAYDLSVLSGKTYRMVFMLTSGDYWLEQADQERIYLGDDRLGRDPSEAEEKEQDQVFESRFAEFQELAGRAVVDMKDEKEIPPESPVLAAKDKLRQAVWSRVDSMEWGERTLGPSLMIKAMQAEHHGVRQEIGDLGEASRAMLYFFPNGYVERAMIQIAYKKDDLVIDEEKEGYTIITDPYQGTAEAQDGFVDVDVHEQNRE